MSKPMAHVFIVNPDTFPLHLEYQFAGTTAGSHQQRNFGLYADLARVRSGHRAYFYLLRQGFYGPFKIDPDNRGVWWDRLNPTFLQNRLNLRLIYRIKVVADNTYSVPISEWDALDRYLRDPEHCLWSLVYRKLKGERGCTMIFPWEDDFLLSLIRDRNDREGRAPLQYNEDEHLSWNPETREIRVIPGAFPNYDPPDREHISLPEDPLDKLRASSGSEVHLQAFLTQNYGCFPDSEIIFGPTETIRWVGNEVACGLGMQKIDLFVINEEPNGQKVRIIELKKDPPDEETVWQLERYIDWTKRFIPGTTSQNIQPILLCRNLGLLQLSESVIASFREFNTRNFALPLEYIECVRDTGSNGVRFRKLELGR